METPGRLPSPRPIIGAACLLAVLAAPAGGVLTEPHFTFYGTALENGALLETGVVTAVRPQAAAPIASFVLGSEPAVGDRFVLRIPLDFGEPQLPGTLRPGDPLDFFIDGELAGHGVVGGRGGVASLDLDRFFDDDPELSIADTVVSEGDAGTTDAEFTVSLSRAVSWDVQFDFETVDGSAVAPGDYASTADTVVIPAGESSVTILVPVNGDTEAEPPETFFVRLSNPFDDVPSPLPIQTVILDGEAIGTIRADDTQFVVNIDDVRVLESDGIEQTEAVFTVSVPSELPRAAAAARAAGAAAVMLEVDFETVDGTAVAGEDYVATSGRLRIDTGVSCPAAGHPCAEIRVPILGNTTRESDETFLVRLSNPSAGVIGDGEGRGTILDDEHFLVFTERRKDGEDGVEGVLGALAAAVSPDGAHLYVAAGIGNALSVFDRDDRSGRLVFRQVVRDGDSGVVGLAGAHCVALSPDGETVYAAAYLDDAVAVFDRDPATGELAFLESHVDGFAGAWGLDGAVSVAVSPDGLHVYAVGFNGDAVALFSRDVSSGALTFEGAVENGAGATGLLGPAAIAMSPDGLHLYVASAIDSSLVAFERNPADGSLVFVEQEKDGVGGVDGLDGAAAVAVSPDGTHVYAVGQIDDAVAVFERDPSTGSLRFVQRRKNGLGNVAGLDGVSGVAVDPTGNFVYTASQTDSAVAVFGRDDATGGLSFIEVRRDGDPDPNGVPDTQGVPRVDGLAGGAAVALGPEADLGHVYLVGTQDNAVAVFVNDTTPPDRLSVSSPSHDVEMWSADPIIDLEWTGGDRGGAGLEAYSYLLDDSPATDPGVELDQLHLEGVDPQATSAGPLPDGSSHYFHIRACDRSDNCSEPAHLGPFWIDGTPPGAPTNVVGINRTNDPDADRRALEVTWDPAIDATSGVDGYAFAFDTSPEWVCSEVKGLRGDVVSVVSPEVPTLVDGFWYFHICAVDKAGQWSPVVSVGPFFVGLHAFAGANRTIEFGESITLGESPAAVGGSPPYSYAWSVNPAIGAGLLSSTTVANPTLTGGLVGNWTATLVVTDALEISSAPSEAQISVICPWQERVDLFNIEVFGVTEETAFEGITAEKYRVKTGAEVTFRAGEVIILVDEFAVESDATFSAVLDPSIACRWP